MALHIYTERLGYRSDIDCLKRYHKIETILTVLVDCVPETLEVIHDMIEEAVYNDRNIDDDLKVIE